MLWWQILILIIGFIIAIAIFLIAMAFTYMIYKNTKDSNEILQFEKFLRQYPNEIKKWQDEIKKPSEIKKELDQKSEANLSDLENRNINKN